MPVGPIQGRGDLDADERRQRDGEHDGGAGGVVVVGSLAGVPADRQGHYAHQGRQQQDHVGDPPHGHSRGNGHDHRHHGYRDPRPGHLGGQDGVGEHPAAEQLQYRRTRVGGGLHHDHRGGDESPSRRSALDDEVRTEGVFVDDAARIRARRDDDEQQPAQAQGARERRREVPQRFGDGGEDAGVGVAGRRVYPRSGDEGVPRQPRHRDGVAGGEHENWPNRHFSVLPLIGSRLRLSVVVIGGRRNFSPVGSDH